MVAFIGVGDLNVTIALMILGIPPILTNAFVGIRQVDRGAVEAARGMGMTELEIIRKVELPLAVPTIMGGVRTGGGQHRRDRDDRPLAGVETLGDFIINYNVYGDEGVIAGAILVALLALAFELVLAGLQRAAHAARARRFSATPPALLHRIRRQPRGARGRSSETRPREEPPTMSTQPASGRCRSARGARRSRSRSPRAATTRAQHRRDDATARATTSATLIEENPDNNGVQLTIGSKNFTEQFILGEIYAQALEAAGYDVSTDLNLGSEQVALKALENGEISGYPEYTSTALTSFFEVPPEDVPADAQEAVDQARPSSRSSGSSPFPPTPFSSANAVGLLQETADELGVTYDLRPRGQVGGPDPRRLARVPSADRLPGRPRGVLRPRVRRVHAGRHRPALRGPRQGRRRPVDPVHDRRAAVRRRDDYTMLEDDQGVLPAGNVIFVADQEAADEAGPDFQATIEKVQESLSLEVMQELNARVDIDKEKPEDVAAEYLAEIGYIE